MLRAALGCAAALLLAGCMLPMQGLLPGDRRAEQREYDAALDAARRGPDAGRIALARFLREHPDGALADDAGLALAQLERAAGRDDAAEARLRTALGRQPTGDRSDAARLALAEILAARGDTTGAWQEAQRVRPSLLSDAERRAAAVLLAELARARGDRRAELEALAAMRADADPAEAAALDRRIDEAVAALPAEDVAYVAEQAGRRPPAGRLWLDAAERWLAARDREGAERAIAQAERASLDADQAQQLERLQARVEGRLVLPEVAPEMPPRLGDLDAPPGFTPASGASGAIGVVLPLSGPFAQLADQTLRGVLLAADIFGAAPADPAPAGGLRVLVRDTAGRPDLAAAAVRELAARGDVSAVIGPMLTEEVQSAADAAQEAGLPLLALTRHESIVRPGGAVFRMALTRRMEAEVLAEHAVSGLGYRRFAILYPKDDYGREFETLVWQALEARGGEVVGVAGYDPEAVDVSESIRSLVGWPLLSAAERARLEERANAGTPAAPAPRVPRPGEGAPLFAESGAIETPVEERLPPIVDFDALFIPDAPDKVAMILPQLGIEQVQGVALFGASAWHNPELVRREGRRLEGAFFTSTFDAANPAPLVQEFVARYGAAYGEPPSAFAAQGFDAANLVVLQLGRGAASPEGLRQGLLETQLYPGVSGVTSFDPDGNARKRPFLVGVQGGALVSLE